MNTNNTTHNNTKSITASIIPDEPVHDYRICCTLTKRHIIALFAAMSLFFASIEYILPKPVPFFRFGLANIPILIAMRTFSFFDLLLLTILKVIGLGILNGTFASYVFVFSFFGSLTGMLAMRASARLFCRMGLLGVSLIGAVASNSMQVFFAVAYIFGMSAIIIAPYLLLLGVISGSIVGIFAQYCTKKSMMLRHIRQRYVDIIHIDGVSIS